MTGVWVSLYMKTFNVSEQILPPVVINLAHSTLPKFTPSILIMFTNTLLFQIVRNFVLGQVH